MKPRRRFDVASSTSEAWRPPPFSQVASTRSRIVAAVRRFLDVQAGSIWSDLATELESTQGILLDVGCGAQPYRSLIPKGVEYMGIDTVDAKAWFGYETPDTRYFSGTVWPVADATVNTVLCTETLEHVLSPANFLSEAYRCMMPGARLILTVPFSARWHFVPHDYWRFTPSGLRHLLLSSNLHDIQVFPRGNAFTVACYKVSSLIFPMFLPQRGGVRAYISRLGGLILSPLLLISVVAANLSLLHRGGEDCLGYTVLASRDVHAA